MGQHFLDAQYAWLVSVSLSGPVVGSGELAADLSRVEYSVYSVELIFIWK